MPTTCTNCGSKEIIPRVRIASYGDGAYYDLQAEVHRRPNAKLFKGAERSPVYAQLCGDCGHLEFFADMPRALYAVYQQADSGAAVSALEELERTRDALADSQIRLHELEEKLAFLEQLIERKEPPKSLPKPR
jgi:hypothetical protein